MSQWSGLPSWTTLIEELAGFLEERGIDAGAVKRELKNRDLLQAASYGFDRLTKHQISEFIRKACRLSIAVPHEIHHKLVTLGPRCFITTNYDQLIETSLRRWRSDLQFRAVTNRQPFETAEIVQSRSLDFVFKPHGDVDDGESIVLTREQYRILLPDGERHHALETARMLLATRPVVYIGFGLRDPDFLYIRDILANTFSGGSPDHYAIMADVTPVESDYWRRNYGVHFIPYSATERSDGSRDHAPLLEMLNRLATPSQDGPPAQMSFSGPSNNDRLVLELARHAARLSRFEKEKNEFPLRVHKSYRPRPRVRLATSFNGAEVEELLDRGPNRLILVGHPGAGKTYALRNSAARAADRLREICLSTPFRTEDVVVPVFVDLKLYNGNIRGLVESALPAGLSLDLLCSILKVKIYLDAFNEIPNEYLEKGTWEADFSSLLRFLNSNSAVISSRNVDLLTKLDLPVFHLDELDRSFVESEIAKAHFTIEGPLGEDVLKLLQKPFFFRLATAATFELSGITHPRDIYSAQLASLIGDFVERFGAAFDLERGLSLGAYHSVDRGEEALAVAEFSSLLARQAQSDGLEIDASEIVNWLVGKNFLTPYSGARVAFFHQSVTEFLAAQELARRYLNAPAILKEKLGWRTWDQALFLTLSLLPPDRAPDFLRDIMRMDLALALSAARYANVGLDGIVEKMLEEVPKRAGKSTEVVPDFRLAAGLSALPVSPRHIDILRKIAVLRGELGGIAASRLAEVGGLTREQLLQTMVPRADDYSYCQALGQALRPTISEDDLGSLLRLTDEVQAKAKEAGEEKEEEEHVGFKSAIGFMLSGLNPKVLRAAFLNPALPFDRQLVRLEVICEALQSRGSSEGLEVAAEFLAGGYDKAVITIHFTISYSKEPIDLSPLDHRHVCRCIELLDDANLGDWALSSLRGICTRADLARLAAEKAEASSGLRGACLLSASGASSSRVFEAISGLLQMDDHELHRQPSHALSHLTLDWSGHEDLFVGLLRLRWAPLARNLIESTFYMGEAQIPKLEIGPIGWWLDWMNEASRENSDDGWWLQDRLAHCVTKCVNAKKRAEYVAEFNKKTSPYRNLLARKILPLIEDLTTNQLTDEAVSFLVSDDLQNPSHRGSLLGQIATEECVVERLLPLLPKARGRRRTALLQMLRQAGRRHGRRYASE